MQDSDSAGNEMQDSGSAGNNFIDVTQLNEARNQENIQKKEAFTVGERQPTHLRANRDSRVKIGRRKDSISP